VPYSFNSLMEETDDPFLQRPIIADDRAFSRRDLGVTLSHLFPLAGVQVFGGVYSGMGEEVFSTPDSVANPEYIARVQFSYPAKYQEEIVDMRTSPVPVFQCALNARYADKGITSGEDFDLLTINGKKYTYGFDASLMYQGFSFQLEAHQLHIIPKDSSLLYGDGKFYSYFRAGGYLAELNYYTKALQSVFSVRYDEFNPSDLVYGNTESTLAFAYNYYIRQNFLCIKLQYQHHFDLQYPPDTIWKDDEVRAEFQVIFN